MTLFYITNPSTIDISVFIINKFKFNDVYFLLHPLNGQKINSHLRETILDLGFGVRQILEYKNFEFVNSITHQSKLVSSYKLRKKIYQDLLRFELFLNNLLTDELEIRKCFIVNITSLRYQQILYSFCRKKNIEISLYDEIIPVSFYDKFNGVRVNFLIYIRMLLNGLLNRLVYIKFKNLPLISARMINYSVVNYYTFFPDFCYSSKIMIIPLHSEEFINHLSDGFNSSDNHTLFLSRPMHEISSTDYRSQITILNSLREKFDSRIFIKLHYRDSQNFKKMLVAEGFELISSNLSSERIIAMNFKTVIGFTTASLYLYSQVSDYNVYSLVGGIKGIDINYIRDNMIKYAPNIKILDIGNLN